MIRLIIGLLVMTWLALYIWDNTGIRRVLLIRMEQRQGWSAKRRIYRFWCPTCGWQENAARGGRGCLVCPICKERVARV